MNRIESNNRHLRLIDIIAWLDTLFLFTTFYIFETYSWGKYAFICAVAMLFIITILKDRGRLKCYFESYHCIFISMIAFCFVSSIWSVNPADALQKGITLTEIFICMAVLYNYYRKIDNGVDLLISNVKWASYIVSIYALLFYGVSFITSMVRSGTRIDNAFSNINSIGILAAIGIIIQINEMIRDKEISLLLSLCIPSFYMLIATQSRKALVLLFIGVVLVIILHNINNKNVIKTFFRVLVILVIVIFLLRYLITLQLFSGINKRMLKLIALFTGQGNAGRSATLRYLMIETGITQFKKTPIIGVGIGNPHLIAAQNIGYDGYLHNNYVELLVGGGIIGFIIYYSFYYELIRKFIKYRRFANNEYVICLTLILGFLVMDYGKVSLYSKDTYFYFMIFFLEIKQLEMNWHANKQKVFI